MRTLNGNSYFEKKDVLKITNYLLENLLNNSFLKIQSASDINFVQNSIKNFSASMILALKTEKAINMNFIEDLYTNTMHSADNILDPNVYNRIPYADVTQLEMRKCENWFFNYSLTLLLSEFEKY
tara:strand:+ start:567 stop:941 length:375 start_codon:yes stop_codon:yes gene_type:complete